MKHIILILLPLLLVPEWPYLLLNSKGLAFYIKNKCSFAKNVEFRVSKLQTHFFLDCTFFNCFFCIYGYLFELILALLTFGDKWVRVLAWPSHRLKFLWYAQNFQWIQYSIFDQWKTYFSQLIDKFLKFEEMKYLVHDSKFEM